MLGRPWRVRGLRRPWRNLHGLSSFRHGHIPPPPQKKHFLWENYDIWWELWWSGHWNGPRRSGHWNGPRRSRHWRTLEEQALEDALEERVPEGSDMERALQGAVEERSQKAALISLQTAALSEPRTGSPCERRWA